jgi:hypothetical protein
MPEWLKKRLAIRLIRLSKRGFLAILLPTLQSNVDRGIDTIVIPTENLPQLSEPEILEQTFSNRSNSYVNP